MAVVLTTSGISLWTNAVRSLKVDQPSRDQLGRFLSQKPDEASAETNSLLKFLHRGDEIVFLHTEDERAKLCAEVLMDFLKKEYDVRLVPLNLKGRREDLETHLIRNFVDVLISEIEKARRQRQEVVINATAGFKAEVVYSTLVGMIYSVPIKYIYEEFKELITLKPLPIVWNVNLILEYEQFFEWLDQEPRKLTEVGQRIAPYSFDEPPFDAFLTQPDADGYVFLSPVGNVLWRHFRQELESAELIDFPAQVEISPKEKIAESLKDKRHHYPAKTDKACQKIAELPYVRQIFSGHFENTALSRLKGVDDDGTIRLIWADGEKGVNLYVMTSAKGRLQTLKVAKQIEALLELNP